jgi:DNA-binding transcriptional LysR family regulator
MKPFLKSNFQERQFHPIFPLDESLDQGAVKISVTEGLGTLWLTPRLASFSEQHPKLSIQLLLDTRSVDLIRREADMAIRLSRPLPPDLIAKKVGHLSFGLFGSQDYLSRKGFPSSLSDLKKHRIVTLSLRQSMLDEVWQDVQDSDVSVAFSTNSSLAEIAAIRSGFGIGLIPKYVGSLYGLVHVLPALHWRTRDIWLVIHPDMRKVPKVRLVFEKVSAIFKEDGRDLSR